MPLDQINGLPGTPLFMLGYVLAADGSGIGWINVRITLDRPSS